MPNLSTLNQALHKLFGVTIGSLNIDKKGLMNQCEQHKEVLHHQQRKGVFHMLCQPNLGNLIKGWPHAYQ